MSSYKSLQNVKISKWVLLPMRLFLGVTFLYAGIQKLADPQFFQPGTPGYIGHQLTSYAIYSPLRYILIHFAIPHANFFGLLIAYGEIAIGLGTLMGLLFRPAAFFGMLLSIIFFLTVSWRTYPYFYGPDIVFTFCYLTLLINGPLNTGLPALDELLTLKILEHTSPAGQEGVARVLRFFLGTAPIPDDETNPQLIAIPEQARMSGQQRLAHQRRQAALQQQQQLRRNFIWGLVTGSAGILSIGGLYYAFRVLHHSDDDIVVRPGATATATADTASTAGATGTATTSSNAIAQVSAVPVNSAATFTIPSNGDPGILVHLNNGQFVAFDATCTHAGCPVDYDTGSQLLVCPCHGATFDPAKNAEVVQSPARDPLTPVSINVDSATGAITLR